MRGLGEGSRFELGESISVGATDAGDWLDEDAEPPPTEPARAGRAGEWLGIGIILFRCKSTRRAGEWLGRGPLL